MSNQLISLKEKRKIRDRKIRALYRAPFSLSMDEICVEMRKLGIGVSKTTVFFAINGRSKKSEARQARKAEIRKTLNRK